MQLETDMFRWRINYSGAKRMNYTKEEASKLYPNVIFFGDVRIDTDVIIGSGVRIGTDVKIDTDVIISTDVKIGSGVIIGTDVIIGSGVQLKRPFPIIHLSGLYRYEQDIYYDFKRETVIIRMGCYPRTIAEWDDDFWNNNSEFPEKSEQGAIRLMAYQIAKSIAEKTILPLLRQKRNIMNGD